MSWLAPNQWRPGYLAILSDRRPLISRILVLLTLLVHFLWTLGIDLGKVNADEVEGARIALEGVEY
jgi:hypothetical protein